jgi:wyosine [tRNA(Phe)-imidazoG37] synthetase (radical SAM superfamily)
MSLGIDLVPLKVCSLNCVYCEVGRTTKLTTERAEYVPFDEVKAELADYFANNPAPDYITFSGSGEPTLNSRIGDVLRYCKEQKPAVPVAVLTNGTLLSDKKVREELLDADVVLPSLDAAVENDFLRTDRPAHGIKLNEYIDGLIDFSKEYSGKIWLEIFILPGYNDDEENLTALREAIIKIKPDSVQLNSLDRPGTIDGLRKASHSQLKTIADFWGLDNVEIIVAAPERKHIQSYRGDTEAAILETISRRPCTPEDLTKILGLHINELNKYLDVLEAEDKIETVRLDRGMFYQPKK